MPLTSVWTSVRVWEATDLIGLVSGFPKINTGIPTCHGTCSGGPAPPPRVFGPGSCARVRPKWFSPFSPFFRLVSVLSQAPFPSNDQGVCFNEQVGPSDRAADHPPMLFVHSRMVRRRSDSPSLFVKYSIGPYLNCTLSLPVIFTI